jgi:hypothetical protein
MDHQHPAETLRLLESLFLRPDRKAGKSALPVKEARLTRKGKGERRSVKERTLYTFKV